MPQNIDLSEMSPRNRRLVGLFLVGLSFFLAFSMYENPEKLNVPFWLGMIVCGCFFIIGAAVTIYDFISQCVYNFLILLFLVMVAIVPAWISLGAGERECSANIPFLSGEYSCRFTFGFSFFIMLLFIGVAFKMVFPFKKKDD